MSNTTKTIEAATEATRDLYMDHALQTGRLDADPLHFPTYLPSRDSANPYRVAESDRLVHAESEC